MPDKNIAYASIASILAGLFAPLLTQFLAHHGYSIEVTATQAYALGAGLAILVAHGNDLVNRIWPPKEQPIANPSQQKQPNA